MVAAPLILGRDLKILDQNNWGAGELSNWGGGELDLRGPMNPNDAMVVM